MQVMRFQCVSVGRPGEWCLVTLKDKSQEEKWEHRELQGPVDWMTYEAQDAKGKTVKMETNVRYVHRVWRRPKGNKGDGVEEEEREISPWIHVDRYGRTDLRVDLAGVGRNVFWHCALWYFFHNQSFFHSWASFQRSIRSTSGYRVDHSGGNTAIVNVAKLDLIPARKSAAQGGRQRKAYKEQGTRVLTARRLLKRPASPKLRVSKRPATR